MAYVIDFDEQVANEVRRIGAEQADRAKRALDSLEEGNAVEVVHGVRKRCKKIRGLVRLVRPRIGSDYRAINAAARDAARELSPLRDAHAVLGTFDTLVLARRHQLPAGGLGGVRDGLRARALTATEHAISASDRLERAHGLLAETAARLADLDVPEDGWKALAGGLRKTYKRGRKAMGRAEDEGTGDAFHEWRKRAKYSWYHLRLLDQMAPSVLGPLADGFHDVSDALGDAHDLVVLRDALAEAPEELGGAEQTEAAIQIADTERLELEGRAFLLGRRLYAEPPDAFCARLGTYCATRTSEGPEVPTGEIGDIHDTADGLEDLTVAQLIERAQRLRVSGRSSMRRADLLGAIRAAG